MTTTPTRGAADLPAMVSKALREAYNLGQRYWQQADSEYISQHKKADDTRAKFLALVEETCAALAAGQATAPQQEVPDECFPGEPKVAVPQGLIGAACFAIRNNRNGSKVLEQLRRYSVGDQSQPLAPQPSPTAQADNVLEDAALWHWLAEYLVGTRTDLDDEIVASETVNDLRKLVEAAIKQGEKQ